MSVKLKKVTVDGYKNLINCEMDFHDINVLVGPNNSGKSNFLEIFEFTGYVMLGSDETKKLIFDKSRSLRRGDSICHLENHKCKPISISFQIEVSSENSTKMVDYSIVIQNQKSQGEKPEYIGIVSETLTGKDISKTGKATTYVKRVGTSFEMKEKEGKKPTKRKIGHTVSFVKALHSEGFETLIDSNTAKLLELFDSLRNLADLLAGTEIISASPEVLRIGLGTGSFDLLSTIATLIESDILYNKFKNALISILDLEDARFFSSHIPEEMIKDSKEPPKPTHYFQLKAAGQSFSDIRDFSDGTLMVAAILVTVLSEPRKKLLCIEEPENCLHPKALQTLINFLKQEAHDIQILITTHSPYLLNQISPEDVVIATMHEDGSTNFERIKNLKELHRKLRSGYVSFGDLLETGFNN